jgi:hypothetical protein
MWGWRVTGATLVTDEATRYKMFSMGIGAFHLTNDVVFCHCSLFRFAVKYLAIPIPPLIRCLKKKKFKMGNGRSKGKEDISSTYTHAHKEKDINNMKPLFGRQFSLV